MNLQIKTILGGQLTEPSSISFGTVGGADARLHAVLT
jgi:hypothetical protein